MFVLFGSLFYLSSTLEDTHHIDGIVKGLYIAIPLLALCLSSFLSGKAVGKRKKLMKWMTVVGISLVTAAMLTFVFIDTESILPLLTLMSVSGMGIGGSLTSLEALLTEGIEKEQRGTITSLYSSMRFIGVAVGPLFASLILSKEMWIFSIFAVVSGIALILSLFAITPKEEGATNAKKAS